MVAAHMDEVGFLVTSVSDSGFIRFQPWGVGGNRSCWRSAWRF
ncbi:hypothetical protein [Syntrophaceticus schinkii]